MTLDQLAPPGLDDDDLDLDVTIVASAAVVPGLMRSTDDNCGSTCASACTSCK
ncbi:FxLD family lanthipeptide [Micromonospora sp. WMMA1923]|uniref:FxLD family lanthipeptide n=1 Tax=Micromonospora sp. WMMA1923 TaxID=3404125 RepID=UPI003B93B738